MTIAQAKSKVITLANAEVGYCEGENNWNKYAVELDPLGITWGGKQNQPWCGEFVLWDFYKCFGVDKALEVLCSPNPSGIPLCRMGAQYFKDANRWHTTAPENGDIIFFYYDGAINHTGIVTNVSNTTVYTVEGNSSDSVARRVYDMKYEAIAGYGRPRWDAVADVEDTPIEDEDEEDESGSADEVISVAVSLPILAKGDTGEYVRAAQFLLNGRGASCGVWGADGDFGNGTEVAVLAFQRRNPPLEVDGIIGKMTWQKLIGG